MLPRFGEAKAAINIAQPLIKNIFRPVLGPTAMRKHTAHAATGDITEPGPYPALKSGLFDPRLFSKTNSELKPRLTLLRRTT
jgi:hypothetical protein